MLNDGYCGLRIEIDKSYLLSMYGEKENIMFINKAQIPDLSDKELMESLEYQTEVAYFEAFENQILKKDALEYVYLGIKELKKRKENGNI